MRICITSTGPDLDSQVSPIFGRCQYFLVIDEENGLETTKVISNESVNAVRGAGVAAAQTVVSYGISVVITGNIGPNAYAMLKQSGVKMYKGVGAQVKEVLNSFKDNRLTEIKESIGRFGPKRELGRRGEGRFGQGRRRR